MNALIATRPILFPIALSVLGPATAWALSPQTEPSPDSEGATAPPWQRVLSSEDQARVDDLQSQATGLREQGRWAEAIPLAEEAAGIRARVLGEDHWEAVESRQAVDTLKRIAALPADAQADMVAVLDLDTKAIMLYQQGRFADAIPPLKKSLDIRRRLLGAQDIDVATCVTNLAFLLAQSGRLSEAEPLHREALGIYRELLGQEHPRVARCLHNLADLAQFKGDYDEAEQLYRTALGMDYRLLGHEHEDAVPIRNNLATLLHDKGDYISAETLYRETLAICRQLHGDEHADVATSLNNLALLLRDKGEYGAAEALYREALEMSRTVLGDKHQDVAVSLNNLAGVLVDQGDYAEAEPLYRAALAIRREVLGGEHPAVAGSLNNLALLLEAKGDHAAAVPLCREALAIRRRLLGDEHPDVAQTMNNLGKLLYDQGDYAGAEELYRQALAIKQKLLGDEHPGVATTLHNLAVLQYARGQYKAAEATWASAADSFEAARLRVSVAGLGRVQFAVERSPLVFLAACQARTGHPSAAWERLEASLARGLLDAVSTRHARPLEAQERRREEHFIGQLTELDERIAALLQGDASEDAQMLAQQLRKERDELQADFARFERELTVKYGVVAGRVYELGRIQGQLPVDAALLAWVDIKGHPKAADPNGDHWACVVRHQGEPAWLKLPGSGDGGTWTEDDNNLPKQVRDVLARRREGESSEALVLLQRLHAQRLAPVERHLAGVQRLIVLPAGWMAGVPVEALTDKYTVSYAPSATMYAWLKEKPSAFSFQPSAGKTGRGQTCVAGPLLALGDPVFAQPEEPGTPSPEPPDHGVLVAMVPPGTNAANSGLVRGDVLLSYDGQGLAGPDDLGPASQRAQTTSVTRGEAGVPVTVWRDGQTLQLTVAPGKLGVNISRDPAPEAIRAKRRLDAALASTRGESFLPLPGTRREVKAIAKLFETTKGGPSPTLLLGAQASEQRLDRLVTSGELAKFRYLHLATHGSMDDKVAMRSALILSQDPAESERDALERVLAGQEVYDGRLTAEQIVRTWKLDADLVTLSACETALGKASGGEGFLGFSQALFVAGARSLLSSLWKVDDTATALLMTRFYENLLGRFAESRTLAGHIFGPGKPMPKAEALREAKQWLRGLTAEQVRASCATYDLSLPTALARGEPGPMKPVEPPDHPFEHPYFWSAFILMGDPG